MFLSWLREAPDPVTGKAQFSGRRVTALLLTLGGLALYILALGSADPGWYKYIPGSLCLILAATLYICTTAADIAALIQAARGKVL